MFNVYVRVIRSLWIGYFDGPVLAIELSILILIDQRQADLCMMFIDIKAKTCQRESMHTKWY